MLGKSTEKQIRTLVTNHKGSGWKSRQFFFHLTFFYKKISILTSYSPISISFQSWDMACQKRPTFFNDNFTYNHKGSNRCEPLWSWVYVTFLGIISSHMGLHLPEPLWLLILVVLSQNFSGQKGSDRCEPLWSWFFVVLFGIVTSHKGSHLSEPLWFVIFVVLLKKFFQPEGLRRVWALMVLNVCCVV